MTSKDGSGSEKDQHVFPTQTPSDTTDSDGFEYESNLFTQENHDEHVQQQP